MQVTRKLWTDFADRHAGPSAIPTSHPSKYRNTRVTVDGITFDSKLEADRYRELKALQSAGEVQWFIRQVPFALPGGVTYRADFLVMWHDGRLEINETKGFLTALAALKIAQVRELYGVPLRVLKRSDVSRP